MPHEPDRRSRGAKRRTRRYEDHAIRIREVGEGGDEREPFRIETAVLLGLADPEAVAVAREDVDLEPVAALGRRQIELEAMRERTV